MKETGKDKVKKICEILRKETLEPAKAEAEEIIQRARAEAQRIVAEGRQAAHMLHEEACQKIDREKAIFQASLNQACKQALQSIKQAIEEKLFNRELSRMITHHMQDPNVLSELTTAVVSALERDGIKADLSVLIPASVPARSVNQLLAHEIVGRLKEKGVMIGTQGGGIEVKLRGANITVDMSDAALKELVAGYIRKDFRELLFAS